MNYSEKLRDPRWQKKRLKILERDDFTCKSCGDKKTELQIHHEKYSGMPWDADDDLLTTLCKHCHVFTEYLKREQPHINVLKVYKARTDINDNSYIFAYYYPDNEDSILVGLFRIDGNMVENMVGLYEALLLDITKVLSELKIQITDGQKIS